MDIKNESEIHNQISFTVSQKWQRGLGPFCLNVQLVYLHKSHEYVYKNNFGIIV